MVSHISAQGIELIKKFEGLRLEAYQCSAGVWTIGYGTTSNIREGMKITRSQAEEYLVRDLLAFEQSINARVKVPLKQYQFDALICFVYNVGVGAFSKSSLLKLLNAGNYEAVPAQLMRWTKAGGKELVGLVKRRRAEAALWRGLPENSYVSQRDTPDTPTGKPLVKSKTAWGSAFAGTVAGVNAFAEPLKQFQESVTSLGEICTQAAKNPFMWLSIAAIGVCIYLIMERKRHADENGV